MDGNTALLILAIGYILGMISTAIIMLKLDDLETK